MRDLQNLMNTKKLSPVKRNEEKTSRIRNKSRGEWFEQEEKPAKFFLNLEEHLCGILFKNKELNILKLLKLYTSSKNYFSNKNQNVKAYSIINIIWSQFV